jgi:hypothetical protein
VGVRALAALLVALVAMVVTATATAAPPPDLSRDPLDRAYVLGVPSVYRVTVTHDVPALVTAAGDRVTLPPAARRIVESGTAFGVAPGGWLATAGHVAAPDDDSLSRLAYQSYLIHTGRPHSNEAAAAWVEKEHPHPVGARVLRREVTQADAGEGPRGSRTWTDPEVVTSPRADLALLRIDARGAPALALDESASIGTPVITVGFGRGSAFDGGAEDPLGELEPAVRRGELSRTGSLRDADPPREAIAISVPVRGGDSGAPVLDADGEVRGVVIEQTRTGGGIAERATEVRQLMESAGATPETGASADAFREGMGALWRLDPLAAERAFTRSLDAFDDHTLAARERDRARALAAAEFRLEGRERPRGILLAVGVVAAVVAAGFAAALALTRAGGPTPHGR